jgi:hypothetical protein
MALTVQKRNSMFTAPEHFVFCKPDGNPLNPDIMRRDGLDPMLDRLGIPRNFPCSGVPHLQTFGSQYRQPGDWKP